jgi:MOSC domain-containing protein YiiM
VPYRLSPLFSWLSDWRPDELRGELTDIYVAASAGEPMRRLAEVRAIAGAGLEGDRYALGSGHWRRTDACEVTLVDSTALERAQRKSGIGFAAGEHRRNLVVRGIALDAYRNRRVRIGEVLLEFHRLRPPCGYLDRLLQRGAGKALGRGAGIGLRVVEGGVLRVGDAVQVLERGGGPA